MENESVESSLEDQYIANIKSVASLIASQTINCKFIAQNAKTCKSECISFAGRLQTIEQQLPVRPN
ncbi:18119_t:CDS:2, partial [Racocetra fulgida]